jgi:hypothetical protein
MIAFGVVSPTSNISQGVYSQNADPTGNIDSTLAIQAAIDYGHANCLPVWLNPNQPNGQPAVYLVSDILRFYTWVDYNGNDFIPAHSFHGGYRSDGQQATIKLASGVAKFNSPDPTYGQYPPPMMAWMLWQGLNSNGVQANIPTGSALTGINPYCQGGAPLNTNSNWGSDTGILFLYALRNIQLNTNGNTWACGAFLPSAQECAVANVTVIATGSWGGFSALPGEGGPTVGLKVIGGQWGYNPMSNGPLYQSGGNSILAAPTFTGQTIACVSPWDNIGTTTVIGGYLEPAAGGVAHYTSQSAGDSSLTAQTAIYVDCIANQPSGIAFPNTGYNNSGGRLLHIRNTYVTGGASAWTQFGGNSPRATAGTWTWIKEYNATDQRTASSTSYAINLINGTNSRTTEPIVNVVTNAAAPPSNLCSKHYVNTAWVDSAPVVDIRNYGATPYTISGNGHQLITQYGYFANAYWGSSNQPSPNDTAINAAITAAASSSKQTNVWIPPGSWPIAGTIQDAPNVKIIGGGGLTSMIWGHPNWRPTSSTPMIHGQSSTTATNGIVGIFLCVNKALGTLSGNGPYSNDWTTHIDWESSGSCYFWGYVPDNIYVGPGGNYIDNPKLLHNFHGNGGGRIYGGCGSNMGEGSSFNNASMSWVTISTTNPLILYGCNDYEPLQGSPAMPYCMQITGAQNALIIGLKREQVTPSYLIANSSNVGFFGNSRLLQGFSNVNAEVTGANCSNVCALHHFPYNSTNTGGYLLEDTGSGANVPNPEVLSIYETGFFDMTQFNFAGL